MLNDVLERNKAFLHHKNNHFLSPKNRIFPKGNFEEYKARNNNDWCSRLKKPLFWSKKLKILSLSEICNLYTQKYKNLFSLERKIGSCTKKQSSNFDGQNSGC